MKLYTSYWAMVRNFPRNLVGLNTTIFPPRWRPLGQDKRGVWVIDCPILKPDGPEYEGLCNGINKCTNKNPPFCNFLITYFGQLNHINIKDFMSKLQSLHDKICEGENLEDIDFAFIFYEKWDNPCSERVPFTRWLKYYGIEVEEWMKENATKS